MTALRDLTADDIAALSGILAKLRPHGAPRWQAAGVRASLAKVAHLNAADALMAAIRLSQDRSADTPAQMGIPASECWREKVAEKNARPEPYDKGGSCSTCSLPHEKCRRVWGDDHQFVSVHEYEKTVNRDPERIQRIVEAAKNEITPTRESAQPKSAAVIERDHDTCEDEITAAAEQGKTGRAEYLAERCDRQHGELSSTPANATAAAGTEDDEREAS